MSETYNSIEANAGGTEPQRTPLTLINGQLGEPALSIDSITNPRLNPDVDQIEIALVDNRKHFVGYTVAGTDVEPTRETTLRGFRNILGLFDEYRPIRSAKSEDLLKRADYLHKTKRTIGGVSHSLEDTLSDHDATFPQIFWQLVARRDPLITALGLAEKYGYIKERDMPAMIKETILAFHLDEFKVVLGASNGSRHKKLPSAS